MCAEKNNDKTELSLNFNSFVYFAFIDFVIRMYKYEALRRQ